MKTYQLKFKVKTLSILIMAVLLIIFLQSGSILGQNYTSTYTKVVVQKGDTLWEIAQKMGGKSNIEGVIVSIMKYNKLPNHNIEPGQVLYIPVNK